MGATWVATAMFGGCWWSKFELCGWKASDLAFYLGCFDGERRIWDLEGTGMIPGLRATATTAPPLAGLFFGSQSMSMRCCSFQSSNGDRCCWSRQRTLRTSL